MDINQRIMDRLFVDSDIMLDLLLERTPFYGYAARLFTLADKKKIKLFASSLSLNNVDYLLSKQYNWRESRRLLNQFKVLITVLAVDEKIIDLALASIFPDFEDAMQYYTAVENSIPVILTRNLKDYKLSLLPTMTAETYIRNSKQ